MSHASTDLLEIILRECAAFQPQPWYPSVFARSTGVPRGALDACLDKLRLGGLLHLTPWVQEHGQGYQLTQHGADVLRQPRLLARLRQGDVPAATGITTAPGSRPGMGEPGYREHRLGDLTGEKVRSALLDDSRPIVTQGLLMLNILWFLVGMALYVSKLGGQPGVYLFGGMTVGDSHQLGSLHLSDLLIGHEWWRLLSYGFVHGGLLHLGMNMYALYVLGPLLERWWGRWQYITLYLISCVGGGAGAVILTPQDSIVGASGAICGLLGSMATWLVFNKRYLPSSFAQSLQRNIMINVMLLVFISFFFKGISWAGHLGGGVTGVIIGVPLNLSHFGTGVKRWLGWGATAVMVLVGFGLLPAVLGRQLDDRSRAKMALQAAESKELKTLLRAEEEARAAMNKLALPLLPPTPGKWPGDPEAAGLVKKFHKTTEDLESAVNKLKEMRNFQQPELIETFKAGIVFLEKSAAFFDKMAKALQSEQTWTEQQRAALSVEFEQIHKDFQRYGEAWKKLKQAMEGDAQ
jgi:rhomboid protease GluP